MTRWRRAMLELLWRRPPDLANIVPENPVHARTLKRADALLDDPRIQDMLSRDRAMRASFERASRRLGGPR